MASKPRTITKAIVAKIKGYVTWLLDRLFPVKEVKQRVQERFGPKAVQSGNEAINFYSATMRAGASFTSATPETSVTTLPLPGTTHTPSIARYHTKFTFRNPKTGEKEVRGYPIDLDYGLSKRDSQKQIRAMIIDLLSKSDSIPTGGADELAKRVGPIKVTRAEIL